MTPDFEFVPWAAPATDPDLGPLPTAPELAEHLARPGAEARLRAAMEWELGAAAGLDRPGLVEHALSLLEQGRFVADAADDVVHGVDPTHPAGNPLEELGNLTDLVDALSEEEDDGPEVAAEPPRPTWIEIEVVDGMGEPVRNRPYRLHLPDGSIREGQLDDTGIIRFDDIDPGACRLELPTEHESEWDPGASGDAAANGPDGLEASA